MKKPHILFALAGAALIWYTIATYSTNNVCYEVLTLNPPLGTMLLDKCRGQTFLLVEEEIDENADGKPDGYTYRWTSMGSNLDAEVYWKRE